MTGIKNGVANEEKHAVFMHCYGHALNLAIGDAVKNSSILKDALDIAYKTSKLIQYFPKHQEKFDHIKAELVPELCRTLEAAELCAQQGMLYHYLISLL